ncbi:VAMP-like protein YKT61 isoform X1 [Nymphaea colorata]|nr:VAMP-like protein YKT61 isoform X1 [Nymphaea colorata]
MTITALLVLRSEAASATEPVILASAMEIKQFGYYQRIGAKEAILSVSRKLAKATHPSQQNSTQHDEHKVHYCIRDGLFDVIFVDEHYPVKTAFGILNKVLDEYQKAFGDSWKTVQIDANQSWPFLTEVLSKFQDAAEADMIMTTQWALDETRIAIKSDEAKGQLQYLAEDDNEELTTSTSISETIKRRKLTENDVGEGTGAAEEDDAQDRNTLGSEEMEKQIDLIVEKIERFTEQVSEVLEAGKAMYKELSNDFEERVIAIHQQQVEAWQEEIKELRLLDGVNEEDVQRLQNAIYLLHSFSKAQ